MHAIECAKINLNRNRFFVAQDFITDARHAYNELLVAAEFIYLEDQ
jgi:hypothetical protein